MILRLRTVIQTSVVFAIFLALTSYTNSTFLSELFGSSNNVNLLYSLGGAVSLILLAILARLRGIKLAAGILFSLLLVSLSVLIASVHVPIDFTTLWFCAVLYLGISTGLIYLLDLLVEAKSGDDESGSVRGRYLAFQNGAWVLAPLIAGQMVDRFGGLSVYNLSCLILITLVVFVCLWKKTPNATPEKSTEELPFSREYHRIASYATAFMLNMFYAVMVIATPVYLTTVAQWSWSTVGIAFMLMLTMFPLTQAPLGKWFDKHYREYQSVISIGLSLMAVATIGMFAVAPQSVLLGIILLVVSRLGAAVVEVASDSQFFATTDSHDRTPIAWYRSLTPAAYMIAPLLMIAAQSENALVFSGISYLLAVTAIIGAVAYAFERNIRSLTIKPSSK
jgi:MFS family permease